jgi:hypothetical protein
LANSRNKLSPSEENDYQQKPSARIDAAVCDLISQINNFSDECFDSHWMKLSDREIEELAILLIQQLSRSLSGELLSDLLVIIQKK